MSKINPPRNIPINKQIITAMDFTCLSFIFSENLLFILNIIGWRKKKNAAMNIKLMKL